MSVQSIYEQAFERTIVRVNVGVFNPASCGKEGFVPRNAVVLALLWGLLILTSCGRTQADDLATRVQIIPPTAHVPTPTPPSRPTVATEDEAIRVARTAVSPYIETWQDVIATRDHDVWRVVFRNYDPLPKGTAPNDDYWRVPLSVFIDATTGIVLRQGYV